MTATASTAAMKGFVMATYSDDRLIIDTEYLVALWRDYRMESCALTGIVAVKDNVETFTVVYPSSYSRDMAFSRLKEAMAPTPPSLEPST